MPITMRTQSALRGALRHAQQTEEDERGYDSDEDEDIDDHQYWTAESERIENAKHRLDRRLGKLSTKRNKQQNYIAQIDKDC